MLPRKQSADSPRKCVHVNFRSVNFTSSVRYRQSAHTLDTRTATSAHARNDFESIWIFYSLNDSWDQTPRRHALITRKSARARPLAPMTAFRDEFRSNGSLHQPTRRFLATFFPSLSLSRMDVSRPDIPICHAVKFNLSGAQFNANYGIIENREPAAGTGSESEREMFELRTVQHKWLRYQYIHCTRCMARQSLTHLTSHSEVFFDLNFSRRKGNQMLGFYSLFFGIPFISFAHI